MEEERSRPYIVMEILVPFFPPSKMMAAFYCARKAGKQQQTDRSISAAARPSLCSALPSQS